MHIYMYIYIYYIYVCVYIYNGKTFSKMFKNTKLKTHFV